MFLSSFSLPVEQINLIYEMLKCRFHGNPPVKAQPFYRTKSVGCCDYVMLPVPTSLRIPYGNSDSRRNSLQPKGRVWCPWEQKRRCTYVSKTKDGNQEKHSRRRRTKEGNWPFTPHLNTRGTAEAG